MKRFVLLFISTVVNGIINKTISLGLFIFEAKGCSTKIFFFFYHLIDIRDEPARPGQLNPALPMRYWTAYLSESWKSC